ncbi:MAG: phytase [Pleurocapsa sp.]
MIFYILNLLVVRALSASTVNSQTIPIISPVTETIAENPAKNADADDMAIYVHPENLDSSFAIAAFKKGGLGVYDLTGKEIQSITPKNIRYNNVDIAYGVESPSQIAGEVSTIDLAIASDRKNDTIAIFGINPNGGGLTGERNLGAKSNSNSFLRDVTSANIPTSIFGVDDGEATAYGLAAYTSVADDKSYVFVSQSDGNKIAQLELKPEIGAADEFTVNAEIISIFEVPIPPGLEIEDALVEGMVVDNETEMLYLAQENFGIWKTQANPNSDRKLTLVDKVKDYQQDSPLRADIEGLTIYYEGNGNGYLMDSRQGDSTFAISDRRGNNRYLGSFSIEGVNKTGGLDVVDAPLGEQYPLWLLIVQDWVNQGQPNFKYLTMADILSKFRN